MYCRCLFNGKQTNKRADQICFDSIGFNLYSIDFRRLMAGMRAGLYYSTWPSMNGAFIPQVLLDSNNWTWHNLTNYDQFAFAPALVQFIHRMLAYLILILTVYFLS